MAAQVHVEDKRRPSEKMYGYLPPFSLLPFMMPGNCHHNCDNEMESKDNVFFCLNSGNDPSSATHKVLTASGVYTYTANVTFGYSWRAWVGEVDIPGSIMRPPRFAYFRNLYLADKQI